MDAKRIEAARLRLSSEHKNLIKSINRGRLAAEEIEVETKDEGDLATISHERELLYDLHQSDFARLKSIQEAIKAIDRGQYGECVRCSDDINEKRLAAVPWATMCIRCQELTEAEQPSSRTVQPDLQAEEMEL